MIILFLKALKKIASKNKLLTAILILAAILRIGGIYPGYHIYHSDEGMSYSSAIAMIRNLNLDPTRYDYPALIPIINAFIFVVLFIPLFIIISFIFDPALIPSFKNPLDLWQMFVVVNQQTLVLFWGRFVTAVFGVGVVLMVYLLTQRLFQKKNLSLAASFLTAINYRQVLNSHIALPDIYNAFFLLLALYLITGLLIKPSWKNYFLSAVALALSFSTKSQIYAFPPFIIIHLIISWQVHRKSSALSLLKNIFSKKVFVLLIIPLIVVGINRYHIIHWNEFLDINKYIASKYAFGSNALNFYPISYLYHIGLGQVISFYLIAGILWSLKVFPIKSLLLLSTVLPFLYTFFYYSRGGYYTRNFVTITPLLLIFAGFFIIEVSRLFTNGKLIKVKRKDLRDRLGTFIILGLLFIGSFNQVKYSLINTYYYLKPWNFISAQNWARENIPDGAKVMSHIWDKYPTDKNFTIVSLEMNKIFSLAEMREEGVEYGFLNLDWLTLFSVWWMNRPTEESLKYWEKPDKISANYYSAVATKELASYSTAQFIKPWQAPDMNFIIVKVPRQPGLKQKKQLVSFNFQDQDSLAKWSIIDGLKNTTTPQIGLNPGIGYDKKGSLEIKSAVRNIPVIRAVSPAISTNGSKAYLIEGWILSSGELDKRYRDGYLRVDFYRDNPGVVVIDSASLSSTVSSRYYGSGWQKKVVQVVPPEGSRFMTVSVDVIGDSGKDFYFDDITVFESDEIFKDPRKEFPFIDYHLPNEILFTYSQANT